MATRVDPVDRPRDNDAMLTDWGFPLVAEAIGAFALVFIGAGSVIMTHASDLVAIALAHGLAIAVMVGTAGRISGGA